MRAQAARHLLSENEHKIALIRALGVEHLLIITFDKQFAATEPEDCVQKLVIFFSSRRRHTISYGDWSSDVCSSDLLRPGSKSQQAGRGLRHDGGALFRRGRGEIEWDAGSDPGTWSHRREGRGVQDEQGPAGGTRARWSHPHHDRHRRGADDPSQSLCLVTVSSLGVQLEDDRRPGLLCALDRSPDVGRLGGIDHAVNLDHVDRGRGGIGHRRSDRENHRGKRSEEGNREAAARGMHGPILRAACELSAAQAVTLRPWISTRQSVSWGDRRIMARRSLPLVPPQMPNSTFACRANTRQSTLTGHFAQMVFALRSALARGAKKISGSYWRQRACSSQDISGHRMSRSRKRE